MTISYDITWDLDPTSPTFRGRTSLRFSGRRSHADLAAVGLRGARLNGREVSSWDGTRLALKAADDNVLEVDADFAYGEDRGFRRVTVDGSTYLYALNHPTRAQWTFCCFEQTQRGRVNLTVNAEGLVLTNSTRSPIAPYVVTAAAGPWEAVGEHVYAMRSRAAERVRGEAVSRLIRRSIEFYEHLLDVPYPYEKCEAVFVPRIGFLAFSSPGLIMFDDDAFDTLASREPAYAVTVLSHEVAHTWSGNLVDAEPWLVEGVATYLSRLATAELLPGSDPWTVPENTPWPDKPYAPHLARLMSVEESIGRPALLHGLTTYYRRHAHTNAGWAELKACLRQ